MFMSQFKSTTVNKHIDDFSISSQVQKIRNKSFPIDPSVRPFHGSLSKTENLKIDLEACCIFLEINF